MIGLGYSLPAIVAVVGVFALEFAVLHTGLFRKPAYWVSMVIVSSSASPEQPNISDIGNGQGCEAM